MKKALSIAINIKSFSYNILKYYIASFFSFFKLKNINLKTQPIKYKILTVLKSPHKYKKAQDHFQLKIYKHTLLITNTNVNKILLLVLNRPQGVFINLKFNHVLK